MKIAVLTFSIIYGTILNAQVTPYYSTTNDRYGYKDAKGKVIIEPRYDLAYSPEEGLAAVRLNGKYGYVNESGKEIVSPKYDQTWKFIGGYAAVMKGDKFGFIDKSGKEVVAPVYEDAYNYHGTCCYKGKAHVKQNGKWKIISL